MSRSRSRTSAERALAGLLLSVALPAASAAAPLPWRAPYAEGDRVAFQGVVSAPDGAPLAGLDVRLVAIAPRFDWRSLTRSHEEAATEPVRTDARGRFDLDWEWDSSYRRFELLVTIAVRRAGVDVDRELARLDVSERVRQGSPVSAALVVERADFVRDLRAYLESLVTDDERRVHERLGVPDSIDRVATAAGVESDWWYFELGRVARFRDGRLSVVDEFAPVRASGGESP